jgi:hypothetical protein
MSGGCVLRDHLGRIVAITPTRDLCLRYLKHEVGDGEYSIEGPGIDMTFYRLEGIVYPSGGTIDGAKMPPRSKEECIKVFGRKE